MTALTILLFGMGTQEIIIILIIVLLLFGGKKIPELMKGLGRGVKDFKEASRGENETGNTDKK
jgi:sec-independent protein translocase protein TatA